MNPEQKEQVSILPIPCGKYVAQIPFPMSEEDFELLIDTLNLWKHRLITVPQEVKATPELPPNP